MDVIDLSDYNENSSSATNIHTGNYDYVSGIINSEFDKTKGAVKDDKINTSWTVEDKEQGYISLLSDDEDLPPPPKLPRTTSSGVSSLGGSQDPLGEPPESTGVRLEPLNGPLCPAEEKARRKAFLANLKTMKPGECLKYITLEVDPALLIRAEFLLVAGALGEAGVGVTPAAPTSPAGSLSWTRRPPPNRLLMELHGQLSLSSVSREPHLLLVMFISEALELLKKRGLLPHLADVKGAEPGSQVTLLLYGAASHFKKQKNKKNSRWKKQMRGETELDMDSIEVTENDLDYYLTKLLFSESVSCVRAETPAELAQVVLQFTKAVAEAPFKKEKHSQDLQSDFYMRGDNRDCVKVDAQGNGLLRLWSQALAKFPQGGLDVGQALCRRYPSPRILAQALQGSPDRVLEELAAVEVRRAAGPQAAPRRLGPELAKKLRTYFTATDGDVRLS